MGTSVEEALHKLQADPYVARQFREAFGHDADGAELVGAIAAYERTLLTPGSRFDRWPADDVNAEEFGGYQLFSHSAASPAIKASMWVAICTSGTEYFIRLPLPSPRSFASQACGTSRSRRPIFTMEAVLGQLSVKLRIAHRE